MVSLVDDRFSINIDNFKFTLISKSVPDNRGYILSFDKTKGILEDRKKIMFQSQNLTTSITQNYNAYTSVSELGMWRLCFLEPTNVSSIYKFDNYIQSTLLDIRLQLFINNNFDLLPFISEGDATGTRRILTEEIKQLYPEVAKDYEYIEGINPTGVIACIPTPEIALIPGTPKSIVGRWIPIFLPNLKKIQEKSSFLEKNYNLLQDSFNKKAEYNVKLDNFQAHVDIYEIEAVKKTTCLYRIPPNIVFQIGKFILDVIPEEEHIHREGYYIFNMKLPNSQINEYGLYDRYISGTCINPFRGSALYYTEEDYVTKPLNYIKQEIQPGIFRPDNTSDDERENIKSRYYYFTAYKNDVQFPIKQIIQFTSSSESQTVGGKKKRKKCNKSRRSRKCNKSRRSKKSRSKKSRSKKNRRNTKG
jgi:hypothetical protein